MLWSFEPVKYRSARAKSSRPAPRACPPASPGRAAARSSRRPAAQHRGRVGKRSEVIHHGLRRRAKRPESPSSPMGLSASPVAAGDFQLLDQGTGEQVGLDRLRVFVGVGPGQCWPMVLAAAMPARIVFLAFGGKALEFADQLRFRKPPATPSSVATFSSLKMRGCFLGTDARHVHQR